jgi:MFS family permease
MSQPTPREARRTALILAASQAIVGSAAPISISIGALAGFYLLGADKSLATAPVTGFNIGVALGALPAAAIIKRAGQRNGFLTGTAVTAAGGAIATAAMFASDFWLFALGLLVVGIGGGFVQQFRFAAADNAPPAFKARAISFVLAGGVVTAILGPQIVIFTRELLAPSFFLSCGLRPNTQPAAKLWRSQRGRWRKSSRSRASSWRFFARSARSR